MFKDSISLELKFRKFVPKVIGNADYLELENLLTKVDKILSDNFDMRVINKVYEKNSKLKKNFKDIDKVLIAFRSTILRALVDLSYRDMSIQIATSELYRWFIHVDTVGVKAIQVPSKSSLERYEKIFDKEIIDDVINKLTKLSTQENNEEEKNLLVLEKELDIKNLFIDSTCIETNIHYPVDWKLLLDGVRTLIKAINILRKHGIKNRIQNPNIFISKMNKLSIAMSQSSRNKNSKKRRKKIFREMKKITKIVMRHANIYLDLIYSDKKNSDLTEKKKKVIENRMKSILNDLPKAIKVAYDRIISEKKIKNEDKIFSLYEKETELLVRKKSGKEVEFGNKLLIAENESGLIVDYIFMKKIMHDSKLLKLILENHNNIFPENKIDSITTDRGFVSKANDKILKENNIYNGICPKDVNKLNEKLEEAEFSQKQKRRSQTESRISILKNKFLGDKFRSKGFANRERMLAFKILAHNLWVIARLSKIDISEARKIA